MANFGTYRGGEIISQGVSRALDRHQRQKEVDLNEAYRRDTLKENTRQFEENLKINQDKNKILQYEHDKRVALDDLNNNYLSDLFSQDGNIYNQGDFVGPDGKINSHGWAKLKENVNMNSLDAYTKWTGDKTKVSLADFETSFSPYKQNVIQKAFAQVTGDLASQGDGYEGFDQWLESTGQSNVIPDDPTTKGINESMNIKQIYQMATGKELGAEPKTSATPDQIKGMIGSSVSHDKTGNVDSKKEDYLGMNQTLGPGSHSGDPIKYSVGSSPNVKSKSGSGMKVGTEFDLIMNALRDFREFETSQNNPNQADDFQVYYNNGEWKVFEKDPWYHGPWAVDDEISIKFNSDGNPIFMDGDKEVSLNSYEELQKQF